MACPSAQRKIFFVCGMSSLSTVASTELTVKIFTDLSLWIFLIHPKWKGAFLWLGLFSYASYMKHFLLRKVLRGNPLVTFGLMFLFYIFVGWLLFFVYYRVAVGTLMRFSLRGFVLYYNFAQVFGHLEVA